MKKLGHTQKSLLNSDSSTPKDFYICNKESTELFLSEAQKFVSHEEIGTILDFSAEPLVLEIFPATEWPLPKYFGACGRLVVEQYCGQPLNNFETANWYQRLYLGLQLIQAALSFTRNHPKFQLYLTDISPDNIAVDKINFKIYFIDLGNAILKSNQASIGGNKASHRSQHFKDESGFVFSQEEICQSSISDHNIYGVCHLLLSKDSPWPMMTNGLLHSAPRQHVNLVNLIEQCVDPDSELSRFVVAEEFIKLSKEVLSTKIF